MAALTAGANPTVNPPPHQGLIVLSWPGTMAGFSSGCVHESGRRRVRNRWAAYIANKSWLVWGSLRGETYIFYPGISGWRTWMENLERKGAVWDCSTSEQHLLWPVRCQVCKMRSSLDWGISCKISCEISAFFTVLYYNIIAYLVYMYSGWIIMCYVNICRSNCQRKK